MKQQFLTTIALAAAASFPAAAIEPGEYTVGQGGDYGTVSAAVEALSGSELTGAVTFKLLPGNYDEEISVPALAAPVTFKGEEGVTFTNTREGAEHVFSVSTASAIAFEGISFTGTPSLTFIYSPDGIITNNLTVADCSFTGGKYGVHTVSRANSMSITGSSFTDLDVAIYGQGQMYDAKVYGNTFTQHKGLERETTYRSLLTILRSTFNIENNRFNVNLDSKGGRLLDVYGSYTDNYSAVNNDPALAHTGIIANNEAIINVESAPKAIATFLRIGNNVGGFLVANNSISFAGNAPYSSFYALQNRDTGNLFWQGNVFTNNIYMNQAGGTFVHVLYPDTETNFYYEGMGTNMLWGEGLSDRVWIRSKFAGNTLGDDITVRGMSDFSQNYGPKTYFSDPSFTGNTLMPGSWNGIFNRGEARVEITSSLNGVSREKYISTGAYERVLPDNLTGEALAGEYSVGDAECDFETVADAVLALENRGVSGAVTFSIADGTYEGTYTIGAVEGVSEENTVTFQSASESAEDVVLLNTLAYSGTTYNTNYPTMPGVVELNGASWITLRNITIQNQGENFPVLVKLQNSASHVTVEGCQLIQQQTSTQYGNDASAIFSYNYGAEYNNSSRDLPNDHLTVSGCVFSINQKEGFAGDQTGEYAVQVFCQESYGKPTEGVTVTGCEFNDYHSAVQLGIANDVVIEDNSFYCHDTNAYFISTYGIGGNGLIEGNKFLFEQTQKAEELTYSLEAIAIRTSGYAADRTDRMPIVNNEFIARSLTSENHSGLKAVFIDGSNVSNALIAHNSVSYTGVMQSTSSFAYCSPISATSPCGWKGTEIVNNIFVTDSENASGFVFSHYYTGTPSWEQAMADATFKHNLIYVPTGHVALGIVPNTAKSKAARVAGDDNDIRMTADEFNTHLGERGLNNQMLEAIPEFEEGSLKPKFDKKIAGKGLAGVLDRDIENKTRFATFATPGAYEYDVTVGIGNVLDGQTTGISFIGNVLVAKGMNGKTIDICNLQGELIGSYRVNADYFTAGTNLAGGIYIARADGSAIKVVIK